jgi:hypothetical protein
VLHKCHTPLAHTHAHAYAQVRTHAHPGAHTQAHTRDRVQISQIKTKRTKHKRITNLEQIRTKRETVSTVVKMFNLVNGQYWFNLLILNKNKKRLTYFVVYVHSCYIEKIYIRITKALNRSSLASSSWDVKDTTLFDNGIECIPKAQAPLMFYKLMHWTINKNNFLSG